jgi:hypothetical protein
MSEQPSSDQQTLRFKPIPVGDQFRVSDALNKCWADDSYYPRWTEAQAACIALYEVTR